MGQFVITPSFPSPVLKDFNTYIDYCEKHRPKVTNTKGFIGRNDVFELNQMMEQKSDGLTAKNDQNHYPLLHLFYHLCLQGDLFMLEINKAAGYFVPNEEKLRYFRHLNPTEQYFYLFKTLWMYCNWEGIQLEDRARVFTSSLQESFEWIAAYDAGELISLDYNKNREIAHSFRSLGVIAVYLEYFGFWKCRISDSYRTRTYILADGLVLSEFGKAMAGCIFLGGGLTPWNIYEKNEMSYFDMFDATAEIRKMIKKGLTEKKAIKWVKDKRKKEEKERNAKALVPLETYFQPLFPKSTLGDVEVRAAQRFCPGVYTFQTNLTYYPKISRKIQLDAHHTLENLHLMIQQAYEFDNDHLYSFFMDGKRWSRLHYNDPRGGNPPFTNEIKFGELEHLALNKKILYLFDYGDEWMFDVVLEKIEENAPRLERGKIIESKGKAPAQYPDWEDEEEYEEEEEEDEF